MDIKKMMLGLLAVLGISALAFAAWQPGGASDIATDIRASFMKAMHEGDYATAAAMHEEYGLGGRMFESMSEDQFVQQFEMRSQRFELRSQLHNAINAGEYETAVELRDQMRELGPMGFDQGKMGAKGGFGQNGQFADGESARMQGGFGKQGGRGMGMRGFSGDCQFADADATDGQ